MALILLLSPLWLHQCLVEDNTTLSTIWFIKNKIWKKKITCSIPQRFCSYYFFFHKLVPFDNIIFYFHQNIHNRYPIPWHIENKWRIYVSNLTIIGSDNGLSPGQHQAIIWTNAGIWLKCNKLSINIKKTHYIIYSSKNKIIDDNQQVKINSEPIERVYYTKFLGVFLDSNLNWKRHIEYVSKKISKSIGILCKARKLLNKPTLVNLYYTFVYPYYIYMVYKFGEAHTLLTYKSLFCYRRKQLE